MTFSLRLQRPSQLLLWPCKKAQPPTKTNKRMIDMNTPVRFAASKLREFTTTLGRALHSVRGSADLCEDCPARTVTHRGSPAQARAVGGGLHDRSLGAFYPWAVVGRGLTGLFEVHNLQTGEGLFAGAALWRGSASVASDLAELAAEGRVMDLGYTVEMLPQTEFESLQRAKLTSGYDLRAAEALSHLDIQVD